MTRPLTPDLCSAILAGNTIHGVGSHSAMSLLDVAVPAFGEASAFRQELRNRR